MCVRGRDQMVAFCREHGVAHDVCGKLVVATRHEELPRLDALLTRGRENGLAVRAVDAHEIQAIQLLGRRVFKIVRQ